MCLKIQGKHLRGNNVNKCLNLGKRVELGKRKKWFPPFSCCPVNRQCSQKKTHTEKKDYRSYKMEWLNSGYLVLSEANKRFCLVKF